MAAGSRPEADVQARLYIILCCNVADEESSQGLREDWNRSRPCMHRMHCCRIKTRTVSFKSDFIRRGVIYLLTTSAFEQSICHQPPLVEGFFRRQSALHSPPSSPINLYSLFASHSVSISFTSWPSRSFSWPSKNSHSLARRDFLPSSIQFFSSVYTLFYKST